MGTSDLNSQATSFLCMQLIPCNMLLSGEIHNFPLKEMGGNGLGFQTSVKLIVFMSFVLKDLDAYEVSLWLSLCFDSKCLFNYTKQNNVEPTNEIIPLIICICQKVLYEHVLNYIELLKYLLIASQSMMILKATSKWGEKKIKSILHKCFLRIRNEF